MLWISKSDGQMGKERWARLIASEFDDSDPLYDQAMELLRDAIEQHDYGGIC